MTDDDEPGVYHIEWATIIAAVLGALIIAILIAWIVG